MKIIDTDNEELTEDTFARWDREWKEEHPICNWIDEKVLRGKGIAEHRGSYSLTHPWIIIEYAYREVKYAFQRAFRGWDDTVIWSIDWYLAEMIPIWMRQLKKDTHGIPSMLFREGDDEVIDGIYTTKPEAMERAGKEWDAIMEAVAVGFESYIAKEEYKFETKDREVELTRKIEEGLDLFRKYFGCFWD